MLLLRIAQTDSDFRMGERMIRAYAASLPFDLAFQDFDAELADLRGQYGPPGGCLILALDGVDALGCVGVRRTNGEICEMKRLYVDPVGRGRGLGRKLAAASLREAQRLGYQRMRLDTVGPVMKAATTLYGSLGFVEIEPYRDNPVEGAIYFECDLVARRD